MEMLNINEQTDLILKNKFENLKKDSNLEEDKRDNNSTIFNIVLLISILVFMLFAVDDFYFLFGDISEPIITQILPLSIGITFMVYIMSNGKGKLVKRKNAHLMSREFMNLCFKNVESNDRGQLTPEIFNEYDLMKYNWLKGSDMFKFRYHNKEFVIQDITIYEYSEKENKDKVIFKGQYVSSVHNLNLEEELILRSKGYDKWTEFDILDKYDIGQDNKLELVSQSKNRKDINEFAKYCESNMDILNVEHTYAIKFYPNGYYVQIINTDKDLFETESYIDDYETFKNKTLNDIAILIPQLKLVNNLKD